MDIAFRAAHEGDMPYVESSWVAAAKRNFNYTPWDLHADLCTRQIRALLRRGADILAACDPDDSQLIFGWVCFERFSGEDDPTSTAIHWVNVKNPYRRLGISKLLLRAAGVDLKQPILASTQSYFCHLVRRRYRIVVLPHLLTSLDL